MRLFFLVLIIFSFCNVAQGEENSGGPYSDVNCTEIKVTLYENGCPKAKQQAFAEAKRHDFSFLKDEGQLQWFIRQGLLVELVSEANFIVHPMEIGRPYVRPAVRVFAQKLSRNLFAECGERFGVTSALRFTKANGKLSNSPRESVHPTGMALDIDDLPDKCRNGFEAELLYLEAKGLIQANSELWPTHYHVTVYPEQYMANVALHAKIDEAQYTVRKGDTLSTIASRFGTTITELVAINGLESAHFLSIGQEIKLR